MTGAVRGPRERQWPAILLATIVASAAFANVAAYIAHAGNPLVMSDAWYFIDAFLRKAVEQGATVADFFVKRSATDHAQPLIKALMLANAEWWGLDFVYEALAGLAFALATFVVLSATTWRGARERQPAWLHGLLLGTLAACLVTLNSGMVFSWSLVTLTYLCYFLAACAGTCAWRALAGGGRGALAAVSLVVAFTMDDVGLLIALALVLSVAFAAARRRDFRAAWPVIGIIVASELCYLLASRLWLHSGAEAVTGAVGASAFARVWELRGSAVEIARVVLATSLAHVNQIVHYFPDDVRRVQSVLAGVALLAHAWFWWRAWRVQWNAAVFHAVALMLLAYGMVAGIVHARVPEFGVAYLNEPRYVVMYLLADVALVLMLLGHPLRMAHRAVRVGVAVVLVALLALQVALTRYSWDEARYLGIYYHQMARQMLVLGEGGMPPNCLPILSACGMPPAEREAAFEFLQRHRLNLYSPAFVARYRLEALVQPAAEPAN